MIKKLTSPMRGIPNEAPLMMSKIIEAIRNLHFLSLKSGVSNMSSLIYKEFKEAFAKLILEAQALNGTGGKANK